MRIPLSGPALRAVLASIFSSKHINRLSSAISRLAMAILASVRSLRMPQFAKLNITRRVRVASGLTASCAKVVFDYLVPTSTLNDGLELIQKFYRVFAIKGDGHCLFRALAFGLLHQLQVCPSPERSRFIQEIIKACKEGMNQLKLEDRAAPEVRALAERAEIGQSLAALEKALHECLDLPADLGESALLERLNDDSRGLSVVRALRCLTTLYGLHLATQAGAEDFLKSLQEGYSGVMAGSIEEYADMMFNADATAGPVVYGGDIEVQGFCQLLQLPVQTFGLSGIGKHLRVHSAASSLESIEACRIRYAPSQNRDLAPILLVHYRMHYDAALPLNSTRRGD